MKPTRSTSPAGNSFSPRGLHYVDTLDPHGRKLVLQKLTRASLVVLAAAAIPAGLSAQQRASARPTVQRTSAAPALTAAQREMQGWYQELQQIGARLNTARMKALQADPGLRTAEESLADEFKALMLKADPGLAGLQTRASALEAEARRAQASRDQARWMQLAEEAQQIQLRVLNVQQRVMQQPAFAAKARAFEDRMRKKMVEVEPQTPALIQRGEALQTRLKQAMEAQGQGRKQ